VPELLFPPLEGESDDSDYDKIRSCQRPAVVTNREKLEAMWTIFQPFATRHWRREFRKTDQMHRRFWEMYLTVTLIRGGLKPCRLPDEAPDACIPFPGSGHIWIEGTAPNDGETANPENPRLIHQNDPTSRWPEEAIKMRLTGVLNEKSKQRIRRITSDLASPSTNGRPSVNASDPYVIALNAAEVYESVRDWRFPPLIARAVFAMGGLVAIGTRKRVDGEEVNRWVDVRHLYQPELPKPSGSPASMSWFRSAENAGISAIWYSTASVGNHTEDAGKDFVLVHNPHANAPIPLRVLPCSKELVVVRRGATHEEWVEDLKDPETWAARESS
jgi:hypothetical protein